MKAYAAISRSVDWSTPADVTDEVRRLWSRGVILAETIHKSGFFPRRIVLKRPTAEDLVDRFGEARSWGTALRAMAHVRVTMRDFKHPILGAQTVAHHVWVESAEEAVALIEKGEQAELFQGIVALTQRQQPVLLPWLCKHPLRALRVAEHWQGILNTVAWLLAHPRPGVYLRQVDVAGTDTRFLEDHRQVLSETFDVALPPHRIAAAPAGLAGFAKRYGLRDKPRRIRIRTLDRRHNLLPGDNDQDIALDAKTFSMLTTGLKAVFITINEINFLTMPPLPASAVICVPRCDFDTLAEARWLFGCQVFFWGDIDTGGFAALDALRTRFENAQSLLMERETLLAFRSQWGKEKTPVRRDLDRLTATEQALYDDLRNNRLGANVRLGQERIGFSWVCNALAKLELDC